MRSDTTDPARFISGCASSWEMTQGAAEWLAQRCGTQVAALYLSDDRQGQVLRGLSRSEDAVDMPPSRLWWKGSTAWVSSTEDSLLVVPWTLGPTSGLALVGPFPSDENRPAVVASVEEALRELVVPLVAGLARHNSEKAATTNLMEAVAHQLGATLNDPVATLIDAVREQTLAERVDLVDGNLIVTGARSDTTAAVSAVEGWLALLPDAETAEERTVIALLALADLVDARCPETVGRSVLVAEWAVRIGARLGIDKNELVVVSEVARVHRIGATLTGVTYRPGTGPLGGSAAAIGASLLTGAGRPVEVVEAVAMVQERWDGLGSGGVEGTDIPLAARLVAVASAWVDRVGGRPRVEAGCDELAARSIVASACRQFDPLLVSALLEETDASAAV